MDEYWICESCFHEGLRQSAQKEVPIDERLTMTASQGCMICQEEHDPFYLAYAGEMTGEALGRVLAQAIETLGRFAKGLFRTRLQRRVIVILLKDLCKDVNIGDIKKILDGLEHLEEHFLQ